MYTMRMHFIAGSTLRVFYILSFSFLENESLQLSNSTNQPSSPVWDVQLYAFNHLIPHHARSTIIAYNVISLLYVNSVVNTFVDTIVPYKLKLTPLTGLRMCIGTNRVHPPT